MVLEKPIIEKKELMRALDPVHGRGGPEFERLRSAGVLSGGIAPPTGLPSKGVPVTTFFCSLNRDAISAVRGGHVEVAHELSRHAHRIEHDRLASWLGIAFAENPPAESGEIPVGARVWREWLDQAFFGPSQSDQIAAPVLDAARDIAEVRQRYTAEDPYVRVMVGRVWRIDDRFAEIRPEQAATEESVVVGTEEIFELGLRLGDPVVIRQEELQAGLSLTSVERGLEPRQHVNPISGQPVPVHLEELLDTSELGVRTRLVPPLRQIA